MNVEAIRRLEARLRERPERYDQRFFYASLCPDTDPSRISLSHAVCCIAAEILIMEKGERAFLDTVLAFRRIKTTPGAYTAPRMLELGRETLGISEELGDVLFEWIDSWPAAFSLAYRAARNGRERVEAACAFLDAIIEHDGDLTAIFARYGRPTLPPADEEEES